MAIITPTNTHSYTQPRGTKLLVSFSYQFMRQRWRWGEQWMNCHQCCNKMLNKYKNSFIFMYMHLIRGSSMVQHAQRDHFVLIFNNKHMHTWTFTFTLPFHMHTRSQAHTHIDTQRHTHTPLCNFKRIQMGIKRRKNEMKNEGEQQR